MNLTPFLILSLTASSATAASIQKWCNGGTSGNGGCEANGGATYCCYNDKKHEGYTTPRETTAMSQSMKGGFLCGPDMLGTVSCAPK